MSTIRQVSRMLVTNISEAAKGDLILGNDGQIKEMVLRQLNTRRIPGLKGVAVINRKGEVVASFEGDGEQRSIENPKALLSVRRFTEVKKAKRYEYYYPITTEKRENNNIKQVPLGVAFVSLSRRVVLAPIQQARKVAALTVVTITLLSILGINLLAKKMAKQIQLLSNVAREVGAGNLNVHIPVNSKDELGQLAHEFNKMAQHLREKLQMQKFVSKLTVQMIKDTVATDGHPSRAVKQDVTVLFSDVRNFSSIAEHLDPGEIVKLINVYFDIQTRLIEDHKGIVDKFMGDQIMAIFQGPAMADNSLRAAVEIQRQIRQINQQRLQKNKTTLDMGIGINNGSAVMGNMGSSDRMDYTVIGDVVNVAARLCAVAKAGQIITSYDVAKRVNGSYPTSRLKSISVKGRIQKIEVCEVDYESDILT